MATVLRPLGPVQWICLVASLAFVALGCLGLWRGEPLPAWRASAGRRGPSGGAAAPRPTPDTDTDVDTPVATEPTPDEQRLLAAVVAALEGAGALEPGRVDAAALWRAAQAYDPGEPVDAYGALASLAALHDLGRLGAPRLVFVPSHTEYDVGLLATITAAILVSLGHAVRDAEIGVVLAPGGREDRAEITVPLDGGHETLLCEYLPKYPPSDLVPLLARYSREDDPRELVCADTGHQWLLFAAIRPGALPELNRAFPDDGMFGPP